jgi:hypothetical protein
MRLVALPIAICALSQTAVAQTSNCRSIGDPTARLACYDKAVPTASVENPLVVKPAAPLQAKPAASKFDTEKYVDSISAEDALMNARLKNICRGC